VFAAWLFLGVREVTTRDYRTAALLEYPNRATLLLGFLINAVRGRAVRA
jgi:hypothetical protein